MSGPASVVVVGSFMMDLVVRTPRHPRLGETVIGRSLDFYLGGKGFNQAVAASRFGARCAMVGRLGLDDFGDRFAAKLTEEGIDAAHVGRDPDVGTGAGLPVVDDAGENAIVVVPQANTRCTPDHVRAAADTIRSAAVVLAQLELPPETVAAAFSIARDAGVCTILNPAPMVDDVGAFRGLVDLVTPNETEAAAITGLVDADPEKVAVAVADALDAPAVLLTLGDAGCLLWDRGETTRVRAHAADVVDTVGAGDAVCGAVAAAIAGGVGLAEAARLGNAAGALAVSVAGAEPSMPTGDAVRALAEQGGNHG